MESYVTIRKNIVDLYVLTKKLSMISVKYKDIYRRLGIVQSHFIQKERRSAMLHVLVYLCIYIMCAYMNMPIYTLIELA